jgi:hypothetical protein
MTPPELRTAPSTAIGDEGTSRTKKGETTNYAPPAAHRSAPHTTFTDYWIGDRRVPDAAAREFREEYGDYWLSAKRKGAQILRDLRVADAARDKRGSDVALVELFAFQALVSFEITYGADWPPLRQALGAIRATARSYGSGPALGLISYYEHALQEAARKRVPARDAREELQIVLARSCATRCGDQIQRRQRRHSRQRRRVRRWTKRTRDNGNTFGSDDSRGIRSLGDDGQ